MTKAMLDSRAGGGRLMAKEKFLSNTKMLSRWTAALLIGLLVVYYTLTLINTNRIVRHVEMIANHPYPVAVAVGEVNRNLALLRVLPERLGAVRTPDVIDLVRSHYKDIDTTLVESFDYMVDNYVYRPGDAPLLRQLYLDLRDEQGKLLELCGDPGFTSAQAASFFAEKIEPKIDEMYRITATMLSGTKVTFAEFVQLARDSRTRVIVYSSILMFAVIAALCVYLSILKSKGSQEEAMLRALREALTSAQSANAAKSRFLFSMSHDIRTPMNAIMGMTRIASENIGEPERVMDCLGKIEQASGHLLKLINEVLNMSKIESGRMELIEKPILIHSVVDNVLMLLQDNIEKKKMTLQVDMDRLPKESVYGDATRILEILLNLASNAVKYTPEGGTIRFLAEKREEIGSDQIYRFVVQDNGIGMSKEFLEKLFEPFAREQKVADGKFEGTGLGMSITKAFVEMMGGDIRVDSKEGEGTTFEVLLRFKKAEAAVVEELGKVWTMDECRGRFAQNRLLLAEDNELNREILKELIRETGISIEEAVNGKEAVRLVQNNPEDYFDLVFMDVQMPEMDGYEAAGRIRQYEKKLKRKHLPIIALTANVFAEDSERALRAGMDAHMGKPVEVPQLLATMMHWIG